jgi:hypothetical protein
MQGVQVVCFDRDVDVRMLKGLPSEILYVQILKQLRIEFVSILLLRVAGCFCQEAGKFVVGDSFLPGRAYAVMRNTTTFQKRTATRIASKVEEICC